MSESALPPNDKEMSLVQHLLDLKTSLTRGILAILVFFFILFPFANEIYTYVAEPLTRYLPDDTSMIATAVASPFLTPFKLSFVLAIYLAMPFLLYQIWRFIAPALYSHEKQLIAPVLFFSSFLFYAGGAFAYYVVFPLVFGFLSTTAPEGVTIATDIAAYLDFVIKMFFAFGLAFEVPVITVLLILTGMVKPNKLKHARPYIIVGAFVIGMLLTPPDVVSQTLLAVPMWLLFELGLLIGAYVLKQRGLDQDQDDNEPEPEPTIHRSTPTQNSATVAPAASTAAPVPANQAPDMVYDDRYADQLNDDLDWDAEFDRIDAEMKKMERDYQKRHNDNASEASSKQPDAPETPLTSNKTDNNGKVNQP
ncbi:MAG: twin-arginine translocase subunit TatC [Thiotrichales bacterium]|nr:twin-arginine translocase subunit TatC [Thiotrichales bacterium]